MLFEHLQDESGNKCEYLLLSDFARSNPVLVLGIMRVNPGISKQACLALSQVSNPERSNVYIIPSSSNSRGEELSAGGTKIKVISLQECIVKKTYL